MVQVSKQLHNVTIVRKGMVDIIATGENGDLYDLHVIMIKIISFFKLLCSYFAI